LATLPTATRPFTVRLRVGEDGPLIEFPISRPLDDANLLDLGILAMNMYGEWVRDGNDTPEWQHETGS
jgi:hypothetical protein